MKGAPVTVFLSSLFVFGLFSDNFSRQYQMSIIWKACWESYRDEYDMSLSIKSLGVNG